MRLVNSPRIEKQSKWLMLLFIANMSNLSAEHIHEHSAAPSFSDPNTLGLVPENWEKLPFKYDKAHENADLVVALGQQSYPIFHKLIADYANQNKLNIVVKQGTCGLTAGRLRKKSADVGAYCCPPGKSDRLPGLQFHSLGISPIALIVHPNNPLKFV